MTFLKRLLTFIVSLCVLNVFLIFKFDEIKYANQIDKVNENNSVGLKLNPANFKALSNEAITKTQSRKYIVFLCTSENNVNACGGLADRFKGLMSAYALSLLTDREFLIKITYPCAIENYLIPNEINWNADLLASKSSYLNMFIGWDIDKLIHFGQINDFNRVWGNVDVVFIKNQLDFIRLLSTNTNYHSKINKLGYEIAEFNIESVFQKWYNKLFKLSPNLESKYQQFLNEAKPTAASKLICAQIRVGGSNKLNHATDAFFMKRNDTSLYWQFMRQNFLSKSNEKLYKIFITSDSQDVIMEARQEFGLENIISNMESSFHLDKQIANTKCQSSDGIYLDFVYLSHCDMGVLSHSGFGLCAVLNKADKNLNDFYVYSSPSLDMNTFWQRDQLDFQFIKFNYSMLYSENYQNYAIKKS